MKSLSKLPFSRTISLLGLGLIIGIIVGKITFLLLENGHPSLAAITAYLIGFIHNDIDRRFRK